MARRLKLRYCPECGSTVLRHFGYGAIYWAITWECSNDKCIMWGKRRPLHGWNEYYPPNIHTLLVETLKEILWKKEIQEIFSS